MNRLTQNSAAPRITIPTLGMLIIYEDLISSELGRSVADQVAGGGFTLASWNAALLEEEYFTDHIAKLAADATMIIVAGRGDKPLSPSLKRWIRRWTAEDRLAHRGLVVALEAATPSTSRSTASFLRESSQSGKRQFFRQVADTSDETEDLGRHDLFWVI